MQETPHKRMSGTFECGFSQAGHPLAGRTLRTQLSTDFGFKEEEDSPRMPPTPFAPFLHLDALEFLELEPHSPESMCSRKKSSLEFLKDTCKIPTGKACLEKADALSNAHTNYSSTYGMDAKDDESEDEGSAFGPLSNPTIVVWSLNRGVQTSPDTKIKNLEKDPSKKGLSIMDLLKSKRAGQPRPTTT